MSTLKGSQKTFIGISKEQVQLKINEDIAANKKIKKHREAICKESSRIAKKWWERYRHEQLKSFIYKAAENGAPIQKTQLKPRRFWIPKNESQAGQQQLGS